MKHGHWLTGMMVVAVLLLGNPLFAGDMTWIITDECNNTEEIRYRFFTAAEDLKWPAEGYYVTKRFGESYRSTLSCPTGVKICYGAWQSNGNVWGVGSRGTGTCKSCCGLCDGDVYYMTLTCD